MWYLVLGTHSSDVLWAQPTAYSNGAARYILLTGLAEEGSEEARRGGLVDARGANGPMGAL